jgi:hypothetical protein
MEPLTALGLAGNVVQFVSFAFDLVFKTKEIYCSSEDTTGNVLTLEEIHNQLREMSADLEASSQNDPNTQPHYEIVKRLTKIKDLSTSCKIESDSLLALVEKLKVKSGPGRKWRSFKAALLTIWKNDELAKLLKRLRQTQASVTMELCGMTK